MSNTATRLSAKDSERLSKAADCAALFLDDLRALAQAENALLQQIAMLLLPKAVAANAALAQSTLCCREVQPAKQQSA